MFLFKVTLFNIYCWYINIELRLIALYLVSERSLSNTNTFSVKARHSLFPWGTPVSIAALHMGDMLNSRVTNTRHKKITNEELNRLYEGHLFTVCAETTGQRVTLTPQLGTCTSSESKFSPLCAYLQMDMKALRVLIWGCQYILASRQVCRHGIHK